MPVVHEAVQHSSFVQLWQSCAGVHMPVLLALVLLLVVLLDEALLVLLLPPVPLDVVLAALLDVDEVISVPPAPDELVPPVPVLDVSRPFVARTQLAPAPASTSALAIRRLVLPIVATAG
jgi:hypothetical protein